MSAYVEWVKEPVLINSNGNEVYIAGTVDYSNNVIIAYGTGSMLSGGQVKGGWDTVVCKINSSGNVVWLKQQPVVNTPADDFGITVMTDVNDNIYVVYFTTSVVSGGVYLGGYDVVAYKLNKNGEVVWVRQRAVMNTSGDDYENACVDKNTGDIYIACRTTGTASGGTRTATGSNNDIYVYKMDTNGNVVWVKQTPAMSTTGNNLLESLKIDSIGNLYVVYSTNGTVSGGTSKGGYDVAILKMDSSNGNLLWIKQPTVLNTTGAESDIRLAIDASNNVFVSYLTNATVSGGTNKGGNDIVVCKMDSDGNVIWLRQQLVMNTTLNEEYHNSCIDTLGNLYVAYHTYGTASGGTNKGNYDIVVFKMDGNGNLGWVLQQPVMNTTSIDQYPFIGVYGASDLYVIYNTSGAVSGGVFQGPADIALFKIKLSLPPDAPIIEPYPLVESQKITYWWTLPIPTATSSITITSGGVSKSYPFTTKEATFSGLTNGVLYSTSIVSNNSEGDSTAPISYVPVKPGTGPSEPLNVVISKSGDSVVASWDPPASDGGSDIYWYALQSTDLSYTFSIEGYKNTFTSTSIANGTYTFALYAVNYVDWGTGSAGTTLTFP